MRTAMRVSALIATMNCASSAMARPDDVGPVVPGVVSCCISPGPEGDCIPLYCSVDTYCCAAPVYDINQGGQLVALSYACCSYDKHCWMQRINGHVIPFCGGEGGTLPPN